MATFLAYVEPVPGRLYSLIPALQELMRQGHRVVVRTGAAEVELLRASCVVCHAGMGITQKALAHGVPVVAVPFGRDQPEVARRVEVAHAGVRLPAARLTPGRLRGAVDRAIELRPGAGRIAAAFAAAGGPPAAADALEQLAGTRPAASSRSPSHT